MSNKRPRLESVRDQWQRERPDLDTRCMAVCGAVWRAGKRLMDGLGPNLEAHDLDFAQLDVLLTLRRNGRETPMTPSELAGDMMLSTAAMTARLDRLEKRNLLERRPTPGDRRSIQIMLTNEGFELADRVVTSHVAAEQAMVSTLSQKEQDVLLGLLERIAPSEG